MSNHPLGEKPFRNIQFKSLLTQLHAIPLDHVIAHQKEGILIAQHVDKHEEKFSP